MAEKVKVTEALKESLLGTESPPGVQLSAQSRAVFEQNARKDEESEELIMGEEEFINAVAPLGEDYVSLTPVLCYILRNASSRAID